MEIKKPRKIKVPEPEYRRYKRMEERLRKLKRTIRDAWQILRQVKV